MKLLSACNDFSGCNLQYLSYDTKSQFSVKNYCLALFVGKLYVAFCYTQPESC